MPSAFTHILLAKTFPEKSELVDHDLGLILAENMKYFQLGALGPDLPYSQLMGLMNRETAKLADKFHYEKTTDIPILALKYVKELQGAEKNEAFAFFLGYACHVIADGIIHPFIRDKVGDYEKNVDAHRALEMRIDVLFFHEISKDSGHALNLNYSNMHDQILDPLSRKFDHISSLFSKVISEVYKENISKDEVEDWIRDMHRVLEIAESKNNHFYVSLPVFKTYVFHDLDNVSLDAEKDLWLKANEANGRTINFVGRDIHLFHDCFPTFYKVFKKIALDAYDLVYANGSGFNAESFSAINLDTGRPLLVADGKDLNSKATYWELA